MLNLDRKYRPSFFRNKNRGTEHYNTKLASAILELFHPRSVIDFGCGSAGVLASLQARGVNVMGLEGTENCIPALQIDASRVLIADLRTVVSLPKKFDLAFSFEVAEHIEEEFASTFVDNLCRASDTILISAAPPGQDGWGHINCQPKQYWIDRFTGREFIFDQKRMRLFQDHIGETRPSELYAVQLNIMVFVKENR
jgi:SAM-dependent methyltransferase